MHKLAADERHTSHNRYANSNSPICILIKAQYLPCKCHAQSRKQQNDSNHPGHFSREFISSKQKHLHHMDDNNCYHKVRSPAVHGAQEPAEYKTMIKQVKAVPGLRRGRNVNNREHDPGDYLEDKNRERRAAKNVPPTRGTFRDHVQRSLFYRPFKLDAPLYPVIELFGPLHGEISWINCARLESVGIWPALMNSLPFSTFRSY